MRKSTLSLIAAAAMVAVSGANASPFGFIDDFSVAPHTQTGTGSDTELDAPVLGVNRTLSVDVITQGSPIASISVVNGSLNLAGAGSGAFGDADFGIGYSGAAFSSFGPGTRADISFKLTFLDVAPMTMDLLIADFNGTIIGTATANTAIPPGPTTTYSFSKIADYSQGFTIRFSGDTGYDFAIDDLSFAIPEPGSLALAGLALAGLGMARRRKVAAK